MPLTPAPVPWDPERYRWLDSLPKQYQTEICECGKVLRNELAGPFNGSLMVGRLCDECKAKPWPLVFG